MTEAGRPPEAPIQGRVAAGLARALASLGRVVDSLSSRARRQPAVAAALEVLDAYDRAGGALLAAGLAYEALFALVPAILLFVGIVGFVLGDEGVAVVVRAVGAAAPALEPIVEAALEEVRRGAVALSAVGLAGLAWGASRLYRAVDAAVARIFAAAPRRGSVARAARGLFAVVVVLAAGVALTALIGVVAVVEARIWPEGTAALPKPLLAVLPSGFVVVGFGLFAAAVYRWVPTRHVPWSALLLPALATGVAMAVVSELVALLAPRLLGAGAVVGSLVGALVALLWLGISFQILLLGAAWTRHRVLRRRLEGGAAVRGEAERDPEAGAGLGDR